MPDWQDAIRERLAPARLDAASETDVVEEIVQHLDDRYRELRGRGLSDEESEHRIAAELDQGDLLACGVRDARRPRAARPVLGAGDNGGGSMHGLLHDLRIALRHFRAHAAFSLMVIGMLALGVAGNAAIFSIFNSFFLRPLPFAHSDRLVDLDETAPKWNLTYAGVAGPDFDRWQRGNSTFESMAFFRTPSYNLSDRGVTRRVLGALVTRDMLDVFGLKPAIGRDFSPEEDAPGGANVVLLSDGLWRVMFQGDPNVLGRVLKLDEQAYTVVGVLPREAVFPDRVDLWVPLAEDTSKSHGNYLSGVGRLNRGVSIAQAQGDLLRIHKAMIADGHKNNEITSPIVTPLRDRYLGDFKTVSRVLLGGVAVLLLIACVNIAALMLVRGAARSREMAIRTAIGASMGRIVVQLMVETVVLAVAGGVIGVLLGAAVLRGMMTVMPDDIPQ